MGCQKKARKLFLGALSIATCGVLAVLMIALVIYESKKNFSDISLGIWVVSILVCIISVVILLFAVYASCRGKRKAKIGLGIVFLVYMTILIIFAICILALQQQILDWIGKNYIENELFKIVPEIVTCCPEQHGWDSPCQELKSCGQVFEDFLAKFGDVCAAIMIILAILLLIGAIVAFLFKCKCKVKKRWYSSSSSSSS